MFLIAHQMSLTTSLYILETDLHLDNNIVTMWGYLYRYREPNQRITQQEAVECREDLSKCRTSNINE